MSYERADPSPCVSRPVTVWDNADEMDTASSSVPYWSTEGMTQCAKERLEDVVPPQDPPPFASFAESGEEHVDVPGLEGLLIPRVGLE